MQLSDYLLPAIEAALTAGEQIREVYKQTGFSVRTKKDNSPVTQADILAHQAIISCLKPTGTVVISEEDTNDDITRYQAPLFWLIDPLDGTKDFIARTDEFGVNIALISDGEPILGVVYLPALLELYYGYMGLGSFMIKSILTIEQFEEMQPEKIKLPIGLNSKPILLQSRMYPNPANKHCVERLSGILQSNVCLMELGSTAKYAEIAKGHGWFYPRENSLHKWDLAAGDALIRFSGGSVFDLVKGKPIKYDTLEDNIPPFLAISSQAMEKIPTSELILLFQSSLLSLK